MHQALYFTSPGCGVCHALKPKLKAMLAEHYPMLPFVEVNTAQEPKRAADYTVFTVPVLIIELEGKEYFRFVRGFSLLEVRQKVDRVYGLLF